MAIGERSCSIVCLLSIQIIFIFSASWPGAQGLFPQQYTMMHWARRIEQEIDRVFQHITGAQQLKGIYNEERRRFSLVKNQPRKIVEKVASDIEKLLAKKRKALDRLASEAERLQREHLWQDEIKELDMAYYDSKAELDYVSKGQIN